MTTLKDKTALVWDTGIGVEHAVRLAQDFGKVLYYTPTQRTFCESKDTFLGQGFVKKVKYFNEAKKDADFIVFTDIGQGDMVDELREQSKVVFGAGQGEKFENHRFPFRVLQKKLGLPTQKTQECIGISELKRYLSANPKQWVKVDNAYRGDCESFFAKEVSDVQGRLDKMVVDFGPFSETIPFIVEEDVKAIGQIGIDGFFYGDWIRPSLYGIEKGRSYVGVFADTLPVFFEDFMTKMKGPMNRRNYRGCFSSEHRVVSPDLAYMIDPTARPPYSLSLGYGSWIKNYSQVFWSVAQGKAIELEPRAKYVAGTPVYTNCEHKWVKWAVPRDLLDKGKVKFRECAKMGGSFWAIKGCGSAAFIISWGNTIEEAIRDVKKSAKLVECDDSDHTRVHDLDEIAGEIQRLRSAGVKF